MTNKLYYIIFIIYNLSLFFNEKNKDNIFTSLNILLSLLSSLSSLSLLSLLSSLSLLSLLSSLSILSILTSLSLSHFSKLLPNVFVVFQLSFPLQSKLLRPNLYRLCLHAKLVPSFWFNLYSHFI